MAGWKVAVGVLGVAARANYVARWVTPHPCPSPEGEGFAPHLMEKPTFVPQS